MAEGGGATLEYTPTWVVALVCTVIVAISLLVERLLHYAGKVQPSLLDHFHICPNFRSLYMCVIVLIMAPLFAVCAQERPETSLSGLTQDQRRYVKFPYFKYWLSMYIYVHFYLIE